MFSHTTFLIILRLIIYLNLSHLTECQTEQQISARKRNPYFDPSRIYTKYHRPPIVLRETPDSRTWIEIFNDVIKDNEPHPPPNEGPSAYESSSITIFVGISSLNDNRCGQTLHSLITNAEYPLRVFFGVVQQNDNQTNDCIEIYCNLMINEDNKAMNNHSCPYFNQIKTIRMSSKDAKGPNLARALQQTLIQNEEFCMQIDAHSFGAKKWDTRMLIEWGACNNEMAILTTYIGSPQNLDKNVGETHEVPHLCTAHLNGDFPFNDRASAARYLEYPILAGLWAAGLSFSKCHAEIIVPYDINLLQIWTGEEFGRGARLWTNGYDFYSPRSPLIAHDYTPNVNKKRWTSNQTEYEISHHRLSAILKQREMDERIESKYDLGIKRTLDQYAQFCGIDIQHKKEVFTHCVDYKWVSYEWNQSEMQVIRNSHKKIQKRKENIVRGSISSNANDFEMYEELIYDEIVDEIHHFQNISMMGKLWHICVFLFVIFMFAYCVYRIFKSNSPKMFGDKTS